MRPDIEIDFDIIWKKINGSISSEDSAWLEQWINQSSANKEYYEWVLKYHAEQHKLVRDSDPELGWIRFQSLIAQERRRKIAFLSGIAASVTLLIGVVFYNHYSDREIMRSTSSIIASGTTKAYLITSEGSINLDNEYRTTQGKTFSIVENAISYQNATEQKNDQHILRVPKGGEYQLTLSDGTKVWLNAASQLTYPVTFGGDERVVELEGEAYFEVTSDVTRPFKVLSKEQEIEVYGTQFNVSCYNQEATITTLVEGSISVGNQDEPHEQKLTPGQQSVHLSASDKWNVNMVDTELFTAWKDGSYYFKRESLGVILQKLSRWYDVDFKFNNQEMINIPFTGRVRKYDDLNDFLNLLEKTNEVKFEIENEVVFVM